MQECSTPHLVGMGPIGLNTTYIAGNPIIYFSEEFVEGNNLRSYLQSNGVLSFPELVRLAFHMSEAIKAIWQFSKIHRDIKPGNIMRRRDNGDFVSWIWASFSICRTTRSPSVRLGRLYTFPLSKWTSITDE